MPSVSLFDVVPQEARTRYLVDGPLPRVRLTLVRKAKAITTSLRPEGDFGAVKAKLREARNWPAMVEGVTYCVDIDEGGNVSMWEGGNLVSTSTVLVWVLTRVYDELRALAVRYAADLRELKAYSLEVVRVAVVATLEEYFSSVPTHVQPAEFVGVRLRARTFCGHCLAERSRSGDLSLHLNVTSRGAEAHLESANMRTTMRIVGQLIGEPVTMEVLPLPSAMFCTGLTFWPAIASLAEAGMQTVVDAEQPTYFQKYLARFRPSPQTPHG